MNKQEFCQKYCVDRRNSNCLKWDGLKEVFNDGDLTALWVADMEFKAAPAVIAALQEKLNHGVFGYGIVPDSYYEAYTAWYKKHGLVIGKEHIRFFTGVVPALYALVNAFTKPQDHIIICTPVYYPFYDAILNTGRSLTTYELVNNNGRFTIDYDEFEKVIEQDNVKAIIFCSPHNPVGRVWTEEELSKLLEICERHDMLVISDEIHCDFVHENNKFVAAACIENGKYKNRLITLNSASKTFNLAGTILSQTVIFDEKLREIYDAYIKTTGQPEANAFGLLACEAAYRHGEEWLNNVKEVIWSNYTYLRDTLAEKAPKIKVTPLEGTYLAWLDMRGYWPAEKTAEIVQQKCRLAVDVGEWFSFTGHGFIRMNMATDPKNIEIAVNNIIGAI